MIILHVTYHCRPEKRDGFLAAIRAGGIDAATRAEDGNFLYDYFIPTDGSDDLLLLEKWRDAEALDRHGGSPHIARLKSFKDEYVEETIIERFVVS